MASWSSVRRMIRRVILLIVVGAVAIPASVGASRKQRLDSRWRDRSVAIDGDYGEWPGPLSPVDEHQAVAAAAMNDGQFLYVVLSTGDAVARRQILSQGLIVWFDPSGGDKRHFGVKFPVGVPPGEAFGRGRGFRRGPAGGGRPAADPGEPGQPNPPDQWEPPNRLELYGPQKDDAHSFVTEAAPGIGVKVGQVEGHLVYELKVPLARTAEWPYAIEARPGALVGFGLETPKMERPAREERGGMGGFGGRGGGMGGRGGGRAPRGGDRDRFEPPKPLKTWAAIQLATHS